MTERGGGGRGESTRAALEASVSAFKASMRKAACRELGIPEKSLKSRLEGPEDFLKRLEDKRRHRVAPEFAGNDDAAIRFKEWADSAPEVRGEHGKMTYTALGAFLDVGRETARGYYGDPGTLSVWAAEHLREGIGEEAYCEMVHGRGAFERQRAEASVRFAVMDMEETFQAAMESLEGCDLETVHAAAGALDVFAEFCRAMAARRHGCDENDW